MVARACRTNWSTQRHSALSATNSSGTRVAPSPQTWSASPKGTLGHLASSLSLIRSRMASRVVSGMHSR